MTNIAILGCGHIARKMAATLRLMRSAGEPVCLYAAAARDLTRAQAFCREEGFAHAYGSYEEMVCDEAIDLVYVATPHSHHAEHMKLCVAHGRAVLCEKAFTANAAQAREVLALAKEKHVLVAEAIWPRYMPSRKAIDDLIASGAIGEPRLVTANLHYPIEHVRRIREPELAGGALLDVGIYPLTFASMYLGNDYVRLESSAELMETGVDRQGIFSLYYGNGSLAQISCGVAARSDRQGMISGDKGYLTVDNVINPQRLTLYLAEENYDAAHDIPVQAQMTGYEYQVRACMRALEAGEIECAEMPHAEIIRVMEIMDAVRAQWGVRYPFE